MRFDGGAWILNLKNFNKTFLENQIEKHLLEIYFVHFKVNIGICSSLWQTTVTSHRMVYLGIPSKANAFPYPKNSICSNYASQWYHWRTRIFNAKTGIKANLKLSRLLDSIMAINMNSTDELIPSHKMKFLKGLLQNYKSGYWQYNQEHGGQSKHA